jgi:hypothetical protein
MLGQYKVSYFACPDCRFFRTEKPYWLAQAYSQPIAATDTGIVLRNLKIARQLTLLIPQLLGNQARCIDVAGGTGLLTRLMRDNGFDFYWEDAYCQNVMAYGFEATGKLEFDAVTAFEALEHMEQPYEFIKSCVARASTGTFIFTTELFEPPMPNPDWDYFSRTTGQHISFFSLPTLQRIAQQLDLQFYSHQGLHVLTRIPFPEDTFRYLLDQDGRGLFEYMMRNRHSLTHTDHEMMVQRLREASSTSGAEALPAITTKADDSTPKDVVSINRAGFAISKFKRRIRRKLHDFIGPF